MCNNVLFIGFLSIDTKNTKGILIVEVLYNFK